MNYNNICNSLSILLKSIRDQLLYLLHCIFAEVQKMRRQTPDRTVTAFYAYLSKAEIGPGHNHIIVFDHVETNTGNGYNQHSGTFMAPGEGFYAFSYTIVIDRGNTLPVEITKNNQIIGSTATDSRSDNPYFSASNTIVVHLNKRDSCFFTNFIQSVIHCE